MTFRCIFIFLCFFGLCKAQDISGLWVHDIDGPKPTSFNAIYAIMYISVNNTGEVIGYTYDYQAGGTCKFHLEGTYEYEKMRLIAANTKKINKSFFHSRSRFKLFYEVIEDDEYLIGRARQKGVHGLIFSFGGLLNLPLKFRKIKDENLEDIKGYNELKPYIDSLEVNIKKEFKEDVTLEENEISAVKQTEDKETELVEPNDEKEEIKAFTKSIESRKNELLSSYNTTSRNITFKIFDNSRQDGDRISIYVNDSLIEYNMEVVKSPKTIQVALPNEKKVHKVLFVANNLGRVPPNTSKIRFTVDDVSHEEILFTNLEVNKYIEFIVD